MSVQFYRRGNASLKYPKKLESRRLLNADFSLMGVMGEQALTFQNFSDSNGDLSDNVVSISQFANNYIFNIQDGVWIGENSGDVSGNGTDTLRVDSSIVNIINFLGNGVDINDQFDIEFSDFSFTGDFQVATEPDSFGFGNLTQQDNSSVSIAGNLSLSGVQLITLDSVLNDFQEIDVAGADEVNLVDSNLISLNDVESSDTVDVAASSIQIQGLVQANDLFFDSTGGLIESETGQIQATELELRGSGDFDLSNSSNQIERVFGLIDGNLSLADTGDLLLASLNISGDLEIQNSGDIHQLADSRLSIGQQTTLNAGGDVCLTNFGNDFDMVSIQMADNAEIVDLGSITLGESNIDGQLLVVAGNADVVPGDGLRGQLELDGSIVVGMQATFQASEGVVQTSGVITTPELLIGGDQARERSGDFSLDQGNNIQRLAANIEGDLVLRSNNEVQIVASAFDSICDGGNNTNSELIVGLSVSGNLTLISGGNINQLNAPIRVGGNANLTAQEDICLTRSGNDFTTVTIQSATNAEIVDLGNIVLDGINVTGQLWVAAGDADVVPGDGIRGELRIVNDVTVGNRALLQASEGVVQTSGTIATPQLILGGDDAKESSGVFDLQGPNNVQELAGRLGSSLLFNSISSLEIVSTVFDSLCDDPDTNPNSESFSGLLVGNDLELSSDADISQSSAPVVVVGQTTLDANGNICLTDGDFDGDGNTDNDFNTLLIESTNAEILDSNDLEVTLVTVSNQLWLAAGDADDMPGNGNDGTLAIDGNVSVGSQALLQASEGVNQNTGTTITVPELLLGGDGENERSGTFNLSQANKVQQLSANLRSDLLFDSTSDFLIAKSAFDSVCDDPDANPNTETFAGLSIGGDLTLTSGSNIGQSNAPLIVNGLTTLSAAGDICFTEGDCDGDGNMDGNTNNDFNTLIIEGAANVEIVDANDLDLVSATVGNQLWLAVGDADAMPGDGSGGSLAINGNVAVGSQALLQASEGVVQAEGSVITVPELLLGGDEDKEGSGTFNLGQRNNVQQLAANLSNDLMFESTTNYLIVKAEYNSVCDDPDMDLNTELYTGLSIGGDLTLASDGDIGQGSAPLVVGGLTTLTAAGDICFTAGDCDGNGSMDGNTDNDFNTLIIVSASNAEILDANNLELVSATVGNQFRLAAGDGDAMPANGSGGTLTISGNVSVGNLALFQASEGINQTGGVITISQLLLGGNEDKERSGTFSLTSLNEISRLSANLSGDLELTNAIDLSITKDAFVSVCDGLMEEFMGVFVDGNVAMDITGSLLQNSPNSQGIAGGFVVAGDTTITATENICLLGTDCDGDGILDNSFAGELVLNAGGEIALASSGSLVITSDLVSGSGSLQFIADSISIQSNIVADQLLLQSSNGVTLEDTFSISVTDLFLIGNGDFELSNDSANRIENLATQITGDLTISNSIDLTIGKLIFVSSCGDMTLTGVAVDGDAAFAVDGLSEGMEGDGLGDLSQLSAPIVVTGSAVISATGDICLTGGDCDSDGSTNNDFNSLTILSAANAEILDLDSIVLDGINVSGQLWIGAGDSDVVPGDGVNGEISLVSDLTVGSRALLQASEGINQTGGIITVPQLLLGGDEARESSGVFDLQRENNIQELAANLRDSLLFNSISSIEIVEAVFDSDCDDPDSNPDSEEFSGISIGSNLTLSSDGDIGQSNAPLVVGGLTTLTAVGDICFTAGDCDGDGNTNNDFNTLLIISATNAEILDSNDLELVSATVSSQLWLAAGDADAMPGDGSGGTLTISGDVTASSQALFQASEGIDQTGGTITVPELLLGGDQAKENSGTFDLAQSNNIQRVSANLTNDLIFRSTTDYLIVKSEYNSVCDDPDMNPDTEAFAGLSIGGNLTLTSGGNIGQSNAPLVVGGLTTLTAVGDICLTAGDCDGDGNTNNDFNTLVIVSAANAEILDSNELELVSATVSSQLWLAAGDADAMPGDGSGGTLTISGDVNVGSQALFQASEGINQTGGTITVPELLLGGDQAKENSGPFDLAQSNNIQRLSANLRNDLVFRSTSDYQNVKAEYDSVCDDPDMNPDTEIFAGLSIGGDLTLTSGGNIGQSNAPLVVGGLTTLTAVGDICLTAGDSDGDGSSDGNTNNDFNTLLIVSAANAEILDANDLELVSATVSSQLWLAAGDADAMPGDGSGGTLTISGDVTASSQAPFQASEGINQTGGTITVPELLLGGDEAKENSGTFNLAQSNNIQRLSANLANDLIFRSSSDYQIVKSEYNSVCDDPDMDPNTEAFAGLSIGGNLTLTSGGNIGQSNAPLVVGGLTTLTAVGDICFTAGDCDGDGNTNNDFNTLSIISATNAEILDANDLELVSATVSSQLWLAAGDADAMPGDGSGGTLTISGDVTASSQALFQASEGINQTGGIITVPELLLGGDQAKENSGTIDLAQSNNIQRLSANLTNDLIFRSSSDYQIVKSEYNSVCDDPDMNPNTEVFAGLSIGGNLTLTSGGDIGQSNAPLVVGGLTTLTAVGDICFTAGDCDVDGSSDGNTNNDFNTLLIVSAANAEILDADDLELISATVSSQLWLAAGDADAMPGDGSGGTLTISGDVTASSQALFQASEGIDQTGGTITAPELLLGGDEAKENSGTFNLAQSNNIQRLSANLANDLIFRSTTDYLIVKSEYNSVCDDPDMNPDTEAFAGLSIGGNLTLTSGGNIGQSNAPLVVGGLTTLTAVGDICLTAGDCDGDGNTNNDFNTLVIVSAANAEILDSNELELVSATVSSQLWLAAGDADAMPGDGSGGTLTISGDVTASSQALFQASEGIDQTGGIITVPELLLGGDEAKENSGTIDLAQSNNIQRLSANLTNDLIFRSSSDYQIVKSEYNSVCDDPDMNPDTEAFAGLTIGGNLTLTSGGDIGQSNAPLVVGGLTTLTAVGDICLTAGDCDGDGNTNNDFNTLLIVSAANAEILDSNDLELVSATVSSQLWLAAGDADAMPGDGSGGTLTISGDVTASSQALFQASEGIDQTGGTITVPELLLGGDQAKENSGPFDLAQSNNIQRLSANLANDLIFRSSSDYQIVKSEYNSVCDDPDMDPNTEAFAGLSIGGDLTLTSGGNIGQSNAPLVVGGLTTLTAVGDICFTAGDCDGDGNTNNDFNTLSIISATNAEILDADDLELISATVSSQLWLAAGDADAMPGDGSGGTLTISGDVNVGSQALFQASEGIDQTGGTITAPELLLGGDEAKENSGTFDLAQSNNIQRVSANLTNDLIFRSTTDYLIVKSEYNSVCDDPDMNPNTEAFAELSIGGNLTLTSGGNIGQSNAPLVVAGLTTLTAVGDICFTAGDCDGDGNTNNDFNTLSIISATNAEILESNDLELVSATVSNQLWLAAGDADEMPGDGSGGTLTISGDVTASSQALFQASEGIDQTGGTITVPELLLGGDQAKENSGTFDLAQSNNIQRVSANLTNDLIFRSTSDYQIVKAEYNSVCDDSDMNPNTEVFAGLSIGGNLTLTSGGDIGQSNAPLVVGGLTTLTAVGDICFTAGDCDGDGNTNNDFNTLLIVSAANAEILDADDLELISATVSNQLWLAAGDADAMPGDGSGGTLTISGDVTASSQALFQASEGINQTGGIITVPELFLGGDQAKENSGTFDLAQSNNIQRLSANLANDLIFRSTTDYLIVKLEYNSVCDDPDMNPNTEVFAGLSIGGNLTLTSDGDIGQSNAPLVVGGLTTLTAAGDICLTAGDCDGDGNTNNDFNTLLIVSAANAEILESNDLEMVSATVSNQLWLAAGDADAMPGDGSGGILTISGDVTASSQALFQASEGINQTGGTITVPELLLGGDQAKENSGTFDLAQSNNIQRVSANLTNDLIFRSTTDYLIVKSEYNSVCDDPDMNPDTEAFAGLSIGGNLTLTSDGDIGQSNAPLVVGGLTTLTAVGDICFTAGDCDGDGNTNNDFNTLSIISATNAEILDSNDLELVSATVSSQLWLAAGDADAMPGDGSGGTLTISGDVTASSQALFQASEGIDQTGGTITVPELLLGGDQTQENSGTFDLAQSNNIQRLSANLTNDLIFRSTSDYQIVKAEYDSVCDDPDMDPDTEIFTGLTIVGNLTLTSGGDIGQSNAPLVIGGLTTLTATGNICLTGGDCDGDGNTNNNFNTLVITFAQRAEIYDSGNLEVQGVNVLRSVALTAGNDIENEEDGILLLTGDINVGSEALPQSLTVGQVGEGETIDGSVLLQASGGVTQDSGRIDATQLLVGGDEAKEGGGLFLLTGMNQVDYLSGELSEGTLQFVNTIDLTIRASNFESVCGNNEQFSGLFTGGAGTSLNGDEEAYADRIEVEQDIFNTIQYDDTFRFSDVENENGQFEGFDEFLNGESQGEPSQIGIAIVNSGSLQTDANVTASQGDVFFQTGELDQETEASDPDAFDIDIRSTVSVTNPANNILIVAGSNLDLSQTEGSEGSLVRGVPGSGQFGEVLFTTLINPNFGSIAVDPSIQFRDNALVDTATLTQDFRLTFLNENFNNSDVVVFWGISPSSFGGVSLNPSTNELFDGLDSQEFEQFQSLLDEAISNRFQSRSVYTTFPSIGAFVSVIAPTVSVGIGGENNFSPSPAPGLSFTFVDVTSEEINGMFNNSGVENNTSIPSASFTLDFLRDNPEFRNVVFVFNDAQINIFENASTDLVDLNVAAEDFEGLARVGQPPQLVIEREEFVIPEQAEAIVADVPQFFQTVAATENTGFVPPARDKFFVVVYFENQIEAGTFQKQFEELPENETFYSDLTLDDGLLDGEVYFEWPQEDDDVNRIRDLLDRRNLDLDGEIDLIEWVSGKDPNKNELFDGLEIPRGLYKILEVEDGKAIIQGEDVDRRFVPEPETESSDKDFEQEDTESFEFRDGGELLDVESDLSNQAPHETSSRIARWQSFAESDDQFENTSDKFVSFESSRENLGGINTETNSTPLKTAGSVGAVTVLGTLLKRSKRKQTLSGEYCTEDFISDKRKNPERNLFAKANRFARRIRHRKEN